MKIVQNALFRACGAVFVTYKLSTQFVVRRFCRIHGFPREIYFLSVLHVEAKIAEYHRRIAFCHQIAYCVGVAERFAHLSAVNKHKFAVHPVVNGRMSQPTLRLGNFVFVVNGYVVHTACVNVENFAKVLFAHCGAFYVPTGKSLSPRAVPLLQMIGGGFFPQGKIYGMTFEGIDLHPCSVTLVGKIDTGKFAVIGKLFHGKVDSVLRFVGVALVKQTLHHGNHFRNVVGGFGADGGTLDVECVNVLHELVGVERGNFQRGFARFVSRFAHFVFAVVGVGNKVSHVGDVHYRFDLVAVVFQNTAQFVHKHVGTQISDVRILVHGGTAGINARLMRFDGDKIFFFAGEGVVKSQLHKLTPNFSYSILPHFAPHNK